MADLTFTQRVCRGAVKSAFEGDYTNPSDVIGDLLAEGMEATTGKFKDDPRIFAWRQQVSRFLSAPK